MLTAINAEPNAPANTLGIRRIMFAVDDLEEVMARLRSLGAELVGEVARYEDSYRVCHVRGPERSSSGWLSSSAKAKACGARCHSTTSRAPAISMTARSDLRRPAPALCPQAPTGHVTIRPKRRPPAFCGYPATAVRIATDSCSARRPASDAAG